MIIATANSKGGVGKTTIAVHLAGWLKLHGFDVALVDCDAQELSSRWLKVTCPDIPVFRYTNPQEILDQLPKLSQKHDVVVADGPAGLEETSRAVLLLAFAVLVPAGASKLEQMALDLATTTVRQVQEIREGKPVAVVVPCKVREKQLTTRELLDEAKKLGFPVTKSVIQTREVYAQAAGLGDRPSKLLWQLGRSQAVRDAALEMDALFREVFPEACKDEPDKLINLLQTKGKQAASEGTERAVVNV